MLSWQRCPSDCRYYKVGQVPSPASIGNVQNVMGVLFSGVHAGFSVTVAVTWSWAKMDTL